MKKKFTFKNLFLLSVMALMSVVLYACGDETSEGEETGEVNYPEETIDIVAAFGAGGSNDSIARLLANASEDELGQSIIVENITGGGGSVGQADGAAAEPDGYTLTMITASIVSNPLFNDLPYTHESFEPVILINNDPQYLVINTDSEFDDIDGFIEYAEDNPGVVSVGVSGAQTTNAFATREFAEELGLDITVIPHDGTAEALLAVQGGHIDAVVASFTEFQGPMNTGELEPILNFGGEERNHRTEDVPTALESGYDVDYTSWRGIGVPEGTDEEIIDTLHETFKNTIESEEFVDSMDELGLDVDYASPEDFQTIIDQTYDSYSKFVE